MSLLIGKVNKISHMPDPSPHIQGLLQLCPEVTIGLRGWSDKLSVCGTVPISLFWESRNLVSVPWFCPEPSPFTITRSTSEIFQGEQYNSLPQNGKSGLHQNISIRQKVIRVKNKGLQNRLKVCRKISLLIVNKPLAMKSVFLESHWKNPLWSIFWWSIKIKSGQFLKNCRHS